MHLFYIILLFSSLQFSSLKSGAEYRAFELQIDDIEKNKSRSVITVLDHIQYPHYYPLNKNETIAYIDSWMCFDNMSYFRKVCAKPERKPSSDLKP